MPEGHTIHRLAADHFERFGGRPVRASSPQGKFSDSAALVDGQPMETTEAHGKHLFLGFGPLGWVHIHLGLFGKVNFGDAPAPPPTDTVRLRLAGPTAYVDLRGPTTCALITDGEKQAIHDRLGPDPLRAADTAFDSGGHRAWSRISRSRTTIAALLMDQKIIAGVGNVYRAEVLFRQRLDPYRPGREHDAGTLMLLWDDLVVLLRAGVRAGRIVTTLPEHRERPAGRPRRVDSHYVYGRVDLPCRMCGTPVLDAPIAARRLFWCPVCQA